MARKIADKQGEAVPAASTALPQGHAELLEDLKGRVRTAQLKAALAVNRELIRLYWDIGQLIVHRQEREGWGSSVIEKLANDVQKAFQGLRGFSRTNVFRMRAFYLAYTKGFTIVPQAAGQLDGQNLPAVLAEI